METKHWIYVAPQRIRQEELALPRCKSWDDFEALNMQRLARVFAFHSCVAFVGSAASLCLGYPTWPGLIPDPFARERFTEDELKRKRIDVTQAIQIIEELGPDAQKAVNEHLLKVLSHGADKPTLENRVTEAKKKDDYTFGALLDLPIRRFVTTNYDKEIERALSKKLGPTFWSDDKSFEQDELAKLAIFAVALANRNRNMVFHCHGTIDGEAERQKKHPMPKRRMVVTQKDYNYWYLSGDRGVYSLKLCLDIILQSNPLLFIGYSVSDVDLLRILRRATLRWESERVASNLFLLLRKPDELAKDDPIDWCLAQQIKLGVNLLPFDLKKPPADPSTGSMGAEAAKVQRQNTESTNDAVIRPEGEHEMAESESDQGTTDRPPETLAQALRHRGAECAQERKKWRSQPKVKPISSGPEGRIVARGSWFGASVSGEDLLFDEEFLKADKFLDRIRDSFKENRVVAILGPGGAGKLLKACQFAKRSEEKYRTLVFHAYNNDDVYAYLKRVGEQIQKVETEMLAAPNRLAGKLKKTSLLVVINNIDQLVGCNPIGTWVPRNKAAKTLLEDLEIFNGKTATPWWKKGRSSQIKVHVLLTAQALPLSANLKPTEESPNAKQTGESANVGQPAKKIDVIPLIGESGDLPFTAKEVGLDHDDEFLPLSWELRRDPSGLVLAALFLAELERGSKDRKDRLASLLQVLRSGSSEMGARVVRHIIRSLDAPKAYQGEAEDQGQSFGRNYESLLGFICCFTTPISSTVLEETTICCKNFLNSARLHDEDRSSAPSTASEFPKIPQQRLCALGLLQEIQSSQSDDAEKPSATSVEEVKFVVHPLVKRFFRQVQDRSHHLPETQEFGLHGLLSRGPFNSPDSRGRAGKLFEHFAGVAYEQFRQYNLHKDLAAGQPAQPGEKIEVRQTIEGAQEDGGYFIRAMIDILRSNFACNSVPVWGAFRDYIDMVSITIDLLRNFAIATKECWQPGQDSYEVKPWSSKRGVASAEEMLYLYNELGLAYYNSGSVQDALSVWSLAFDWQKAVSIDDRDQGTMYAASLNSHIGMAYMQLGWLQSATERFEAARVGAEDTINSDLAWRMKGMLGRIEHFHGNSPAAKKKYQKVAIEMEKLGNRRAESYFKRHLAALETRLGNTVDAVRLARECKALAASQNAPDLIAFASEMEGRAHSAAGENEKAIRKFRIALAEAERLDISRLKADILLGLAKIQLRLGDANAARRRAIEVMELANENLLVLRQAKALVIFGKVAAELGEDKLAHDILDHAVQLAADSQFRLVEGDAREALAELKVGGPVETGKPF